MYLKLYIILLVNAEVEMKLLCGFLTSFPSSKMAWTIHAAKLVLHVTALLCTQCTMPCSISAHAKLG